MNDNNNDLVIELRQLISELLSDPVWRGSRLPQLSDINKNDIEFRINKQIEYIEIYIESLKDEIHLWNEEATV